MLLMIVSERIKREITDQWERKYTKTHHKAKKIACKYVAVELIFFN